MNKENFDCYMRFENVSDEELTLLYGKKHWESEEYCEPEYCMYWKLTLNENTEIVLQWLQKGWLCVACLPHQIEEVFNYFKKYHQNPYTKYSQETKTWESKMAQDKSENHNQKSHLIRTSFCSVQTR